jgi:hypothetical protein
VHLLPTRVLLYAAAQLIQVKASEERPDMVLLLNWEDSRQAGGHDRTETASRHLIGSGHGRFRKSGRQ